MTNETEKRLLLLLLWLIENVPGNLPERTEAIEEAKEIGRLIGLSNEQMLEEA